MIYDSLIKACGVITNWTKLKNFFVGKTFHKDTVCNLRRALYNTIALEREKSMATILALQKLFITNQYHKKSTFNILIPISLHKMYEPYAVYHYSYIIFLDYMETLPVSIMYGSSYVSVNLELIHDLWVPNIFIYNLKTFRVIDVLSKLAGLWINSGKKIYYR